MLTLMLTLALLAGCVTAPTEPTDPDDANDTHMGHATTRATTWTGCEQWHLHFDARAEDFQSQMPPGFAPTANDAGLTQLLIHATFCPDVQEAYLAVPVTVPTDLDDPNRTELATIQVFHAGHATGLYPEPFTPSLVDATFERQDTPAGPALTVTGGGEAFTLTNVLNPSSGPFGAEHWARFAHDGTTFARATFDGNESRNVGFGPVAYTHEGPGGAPPATAGIAHIVNDLDIHIETETFA